MRKKIGLNFNWFFSSKFLDKHLYEYSNTEGFELVDIPHSSYITPLNNFNEDELARVSTYKKIVYIKKEYYGSKIRLLFEGVAHLTTIYVNDNFVIEHKGGYDEFYADITDFVEYGKNNIITVIVNSHYNETIPPFGSYLNFLGYGGIYREVYLEVSNDERILDYKIRTPNVNDSVSAYCDVTISKFPVNIELTIKYNGEVKLSRGYNVYQKTSVLEFSIPDRLLWDIDNPNLYEASIDMVDGGIVLDSVMFNFGYREVFVNKEGFYLNGKAVKLIGLTRSQAYPYVGMAMPKSVQEKDADILKYDLGLNCVLLNSSIHSKHFINRCDEIGLLVIEEVPGWYYIGGDEFKVNTVKNLKSMITRDINHPSVIMWGVSINGSNSDPGLYTETNRVAHLLDSTRPTFGSNEFEDTKCLHDVYGFSEKPNIYKKILKSKYLKSKPTLISSHTGYNYPVKRMDKESVRIGQAIKHLDVLNEYMSTDNIGIIGSTLTDFNTNRNFGSGDNVIYSGVLDMFRNEKLSSYVYKSMQEDEPILYLASSLSRDDYDNQSLSDVYLFTNMDFVDIYRNDILMGRFRPDKKMYPFLKHPPIILKELIGDLFVTSENFNVDDSKKLKKLIRKLEDNKLSKMDKISINLIMLKYKLKYKDLLNLYHKYIIGEPNKETIYRFEGYRNNEHLKTMYYSKKKNSVIKIKADKEELYVGDTYDATRVVIKVVDEYDNLMPYTLLPVTLKTYGGIDLIGPSHIIICGGYAAFWVKTNGQNESGCVSINVNNDVQNVEFKIINLQENE